VRERKCKHCGDKYQPTKTFQAVCGNYQCAIEHGKTLKAKSNRRDLRDAKRRLKTHGQWAKEAQTEFNRFIRARDKILPCISCGRFHDGQWHAGHYRTVGGHPELRFDEQNCHRQCAPCNNFKSGDLVSYRENLIEKIGMKAVRSIEGPHEARHYTIEDLQRIKKDYRLKAKRLSHE